MLPELDLTALKSVNMEVLNEFILQDKKKKLFGRGREHENGNSVRVKK